MGANTEIAWCDDSWSPWWGCAKVSDGCKNCYADTFSRRVGHGARLPTIWGVNAERKFFGDAHWRGPLKWNAKAAKLGVRRKVFCASMADVFEDRPELRVPRAELVVLIEKTPHLDWLLLTKRPENVERLVSWRGAGWPENVWLGTTAEDQKRANERIPILLSIPAAVRFLSCEPLLEAVDLTRIVEESGVGVPSGIPWSVELDGLRGFCASKAEDDTPAVRGLQWVIVGGESGPKARPFNPTWARDVVGQCKAAGVACFVKQFGANVLDFAGAIHDRAGRDMAEWPAELRVREFPR